MMKGFLHGFAAAALVFAVAGPVMGQDVLNVDFSTGFTNDTALLDQQGWVTGGTADTTSAFWVENGLLRVYSDAVGNQFLYHEIPVQKGIVTLSWDWQYEGDGTAIANTGIGLSDTGNLDAGTANGVFDYPEQSAYARMADGLSAGASTIDVRYGDLAGGGGFKTLALFPYKDGKKMKMRMVVDVANQKYDTFGQREGEAEVQLGNDDVFRRGVSTATGGLNCVLLFDNITADAGVAVTYDNIKVTPSGATSVADWSVLD